jgi:molybdopterin converting factor small subunit
VAQVRLRAPLKDLAGGSDLHDVDADSVGLAIRTLEISYPRLRGWILDDRGEVRRHVNVFVNGERMVADAALGPDDVVYVLPSISGGTE